MNENCEKCKYWAFLMQFRGDETKKVGICRRRAPVLNGYTQASFPEILNDGWCGEYENNLEVKSDG